MYKYKMFTSLEQLTKFLNANKIERSQILLLQIMHSKAYLIWEG